MYPPVLQTTGAVEVVISEAEKALAELDKRIETLRETVANQSNPNLKKRFSEKLEKCLREREELVANVQA
eukprot:m.110643 g.110643  ORF g.110643 m.110643 type:complete len:70 (-) comp16988_c0_seq2:135-344(-)